MGLPALDAGIEAEGGAALRARPGDQPIEQRIAVALRATGGVRYQIVDVAGFARVKHIHEAKARRCLDDLFTTFWHAREANL